MKNYIFRRLLLLIPVVFGVITLVFAFLRITPGDPVVIMLGEQAKQADIEQMRKQLGLEGPLHKQYFSYLKGLSKGDLGESFLKREAVSKLVWQRLGATFELALASMLVAMVVAFPLGVFSARRAGSIVDATAGAFSLLGVSMPNFWLGPMLIILFSIKLGITPVSGGGGWRYLILPAITLGTSLAGILARLTRSGLLEVLSSPYVRTARAKGASEGRVMWVHALRNAMLSVITVMGIQFGVLLGGAVITETVFSWPGIGLLLIEAINARDYPLVQGCVLTMGISYVIVNLLTDLTYALVDPRIRYK